MRKREVGRKGNNKASVGARCLDGWRKERVQKQCVSLESVKDVTNDSLSRGECVLAPPIVAIRLFAVTHCRAGAEKGQAERPRDTSSFIVGTTAVGVLRLRPLLLSQPRVRM